MGMHATFDTPARQHMARDPRAHVTLAPPEGLLARHTRSLLGSIGAWLPDLAAAVALSSFMAGVTVFLSVLGH